MICRIGVPVSWTEGSSRQCDAGTKAGDVDADVDEAVDEEVDEEVDADVEAESMPKMPKNSYPRAAGS